MSAPLRMTRLLRMTRVASQAAARHSLRPMAHALAASTPIASPPLVLLPSRAFSKAAGKKTKGKSDKQPSVATDAEDGDAEQAVAALLEKTKKNMTGAVLQFTRTLAQMRPGRADAGMFDELHVPAYGQHVPLSQVAQVSVSGSHAVTVNIYDPSLLPEVKKAVEAMNPVFSVREDAHALQISFPKMSKETRAEMIKAVKKHAEQSRQHVRRVRQDAMNHAKKFKDNMSEDDVKAHQDEIQELTDEAVKEISALLAAKEKDLMEV